MSTGFTDSIDGNIELLRELLRGQPRGALERSKRAAAAVEGLILRIQKDSPKDPAIALGVAFALHVIAQRIVQADGGPETGGDKPLIQLLN